MNRGDLGASCLGASPFPSCVSLGQFLNLRLLACKMGGMLLSSLQGCCGH